MYFVSQEQFCTYTYGRVGTYIYVAFEEKLKPININIIN